MLVRAAIDIIDEIFINLQVAEDEEDQQSHLEDLRNIRACVSKHIREAEVLMNVT